MNHEFLKLPELDLGTLAYRGSPTLGSAIVYSSEQKRWGRVVIPEVSSVAQPERWFNFLVADRVAQSMLMVLMFALVLVGIGTYGFGRSVVGHRVALPVSCQGSNAACSLALKPDGVVASRRHSPSQRVEWRRDQTTFEP